MSPMLVESPRLQSSSVTGRSLRLIALGGICGLAWSASLRGWMTQLAGTESSFTWTGTFLLVLLPGVLVGGLLGWAEALRQSGDIAAGGGWLSRRRCSSSPSPIRRTSPPSFKPEWGWSPRRSFWSGCSAATRSLLAGRPGHGSEPGSWPWPASRQRLYDQ